jgi:endonuclease/exonuclease/phosphatase family metal-dependent hydrolase
VGDFNAEAGANKAYEILVGEEGLKDLWLAAAERRNEGLNSFHDFTGPKSGGVRIDWILGREVASVTAAEIVTFSENGQFPSDHFPVAAWLKLMPPAR